MMDLYFCALLHMSILDGHTDFTRGNIKSQKSRIVYSNVYESCATVSTFPIFNAKARCGLSAVTPRKFIRIFISTNNQGHN